MKLWLVCKFSLDFRNISCFNSYFKIHFLKMRAGILYHHYISIENFNNMYPLVFAIVTERLLWNLSLLYIRTRNGVIWWYVLALQCLFHFTVFMSLLSISLFFCIFFCGVGKFVNTYNKAVQLFLAS